MFLKTKLNPQSGLDPQWQLVQPSTLFIMTRQVSSIKLPGVKIPHIWPWKTQLELNAGRVLTSPPSLEKKLATSVEMKPSTAMLPKLRLKRPVSTRSHLTSILCNMAITHMLVIISTFTIWNTPQLMVPQAPSRVTTIVYSQLRAFNKTLDLGALLECQENSMPTILSESNIITLMAGSTNKNVRFLLLFSSSF